MTPTNNSNGLRRPSSVHPDDNTVPIIDKPNRSGSIRSERRPSVAAGFSLPPSTNDSPNSPGVDSILSYDEENGVDYKFDGKPFISQKELPENIHEVDPNSQSSASKIPGIGVAKNPDDIGESEDVLLNRRKSSVKGSDQLPSINERDTRNRRSSSLASDANIIDPKEEKKYDYTFNDEYLTKAH